MGTSSGARGAVDLVVDTRGAPVDGEPSEKFPVD